MKWLGAKLLLATMIVTAFTNVSRAETPIDPSLPVFTPSEKTTGKITVGGSMTMAQLAAIWADTFKKQAPGVEFELVAQGSTNAIPALIEGKSDFALLSRPISEQEFKAFQDKFGYAPTVVVPALEQIAIYVHKDNPIESITPAQLDAIFSKTLKRGATQTASTWGDLGVKGDLASKPVVVQGRRDETGLQVYFQAVVLLGGEYRDDMIENQSSIDLIKGITSNPGSIGFGGAAMANPDIKAVPLVLQEGQEPLAVNTPGYPLVRPLQIIVNHAPGKELTGAEGEFYKFIFSQRGQQDVIIGGLVPISARPAQIALEAVGLKTLN
ncbi:MAG TPA: substrate-binding domain-containing protein [Planctomicrobium sp.]|nr:substrate-binding domain-containing protein [Planctomicrobium sp.]